MKNYNVEHLFEKENIDEKTECLCQYVSGKNRKVRIHNHDFYEIFLTLSNTSHFINGKTEDLKPGTLLFIRPNDIHGILYDRKDDCEILNFSFSISLLELMTSYLAVSRTYIDSLQSFKIHLDRFQTQKISEKLGKIISANNSDALYSRCVLFELVTMFLKQADNDEKLFPAWFENMCLLMKEKDNFIAGTGKMIEISGKSREYIARSVKKFLGITPTEFVNDLRLTYAASQIISTSKSITDICLNSGFYSISWFNKMFMQKYGMGPREFRKKEQHYESADF